MASKVNIDKFCNFVEELSWLLSNYKDLKLEEVVKHLRLNSKDSLEKNNNFDRRALVGIFPELFQNKELFPNNQAIIEFSNEVLRTSLNPAKKRSKTEIIGEIVCTTYDLSNKELEKVVKALNKVIDDEIIVTNVVKLKTDNSFSWNNLIKKLSGDGDNVDE